GRHTVAIEATGAMNPAATGSQVVVDAFDIRARLEDTDPSIVYTGTWDKENPSRAWSGTSANTGAATAALSSSAGAHADFTFTGTAVSWISFRGPISEIAEVWLDGAFMNRLDLYAPTETVRAPVFTAPGLAA